MAHERVLTCDFDELSENNLFNKIIKTTVMLLLKNTKVKAKYKDDLKKKGYISKTVNSRNRINEKIIFLHVNNTEEICDLMHSFLD